MHPLVYLVAIALASGAASIWFARHLRQYNACAVRASETGCEDQMCRYDEIIQCADVVGKRAPWVIATMACIMTVLCLAAWHILSSEQ